MLSSSDKRTLWAPADKLRVNMDAAEYKHIVLGLIFPKYVCGAFTHHRQVLAARFADPNDECFLDDDSLLESELEDRDYYTSANVFWVPEAACREKLAPEVGGCRLARAVGPEREEGRTERVGGIWLLQVLVAPFCLTCD